MKQKIIQLFAAFLISLILGMPASIAFSIGTPTSTVIDDNTVKVDWTTSDPATAELTYGKTTPAVTKKQDVLNTTHSVLLTSLAPDTEYNYEIEATDENDETVENDNSGSYFTFRTLESITITDINHVVVAEVGDQVIYSINWTTDVPTNENYILYGNDTDNLLDKKQGAPNALIHILEEKFNKGETYYYEVHSDYKSKFGGSFTVPFDITPPEFTIENFDPKTKDMIEAGSSNLRNFPLVGLTEPNASFKVFVNEFAKSPFKADIDGRFNSTVIINDGLNEIRLEVSDEHNNMNEFYFNLTADVNAPEIILINFTESTINTTAIIQGVLSENATVKIEATGNSAKEFVNVIDFETIITLDDFTNVTITAIDAAGNENIINRTISRIGEPEIKLLFPPDDGSDMITFTTKRKVIAIEGETTPESSVQFYVYPDEDMPSQQPLYNVTSDENGYFRREIGIFYPDMDLGSFFGGKDPQSHGGGTEDQIKSYFTTENDTITYIGLAAVDSYGRLSLQNKTIKAINKKCGSGEPDWTTIVTQDPHSFKPYRLRDGTELLNLKVQLIWRGWTDNYKVNSVTVVPMGTEEMLQEWDDDDMYECFTKGKVFQGQSPVAVSFNRNRTFWYFQYKLNAWKDLNDTAITKWDEAFKSLANGQCKIPLKIRIDYEKENLLCNPEPGKPCSTERAAPYEDCHVTTNQIQPRVDPRMVLPKWLREDGLTFITDSIDFLEGVEEIFEVANKWLTRTCWVAYGLYFGKVISTATKCYPAAIAGDDVGKWNECQEKIEKEKTFYNKMRMACDRVWCKSAPVKPKDDNILPVSVKEIGDLKPKGNKCLPADEFYCTKETGGDAIAYDLGRNCDPNYPAVIEKGKDNSIRQPNIRTYYTEDCPAGCCLRKEMISGPGANIKGIQIMKAEDWKPQNFQDTKADEWLVDENWNFGSYFGYGGEVFVNKETGIISNSFANGSGIGKEMKALVSGKGEGIEKNVAKYVEGLYSTSCFDQTRVGITGKRAYFEPTQNFVSALQCGCVSQLYGYVQQYKNLLIQARQCLEEVDQGESITAGACKELFANYVCDLFTYVLVDVIKENLFPSGGERIQAIKNLSEQSDPRPSELIGIGMKGASERFMSDYGGSVLGGAGYDAQGISHKVCMGALFQEWDPGLKALFGGDNQAPPRQSNVIISTAKREQIGTNPIMGTASFEYHMGIWLSAGSNLRSYTIEILCDNGANGLGDCPGQPIPRRFVASDGSFAAVETNVEMNEVRTPGGSMFVDNLKYRFNKVRVCWTSERKEFSGCEEKEIEEQTIAQFACQVTPTTLPTGNRIFECDFETTDEYADFISKPPLAQVVDVTSATMNYKIPFVIRASYGARQPMFNPFVLAYGKAGGETGIDTLSGTENILEGTTTQDQYGLVVNVDSSFFGSQEEKANIEPNKGSVGSGCILSSRSGRVTEYGELIIKWPSDETEFKTGFIQSSKATEIEIDQKTGTEEASVSFRFNGIKFITFLKKGSDCRVYTEEPLATPTSVTKQYKIGIYDSNPGVSGSLGAVTYDASGGKQEYIVSVTFNDKISSTQQVTTGLDITLGVDSSTVVPGGKLKFKITSESSNIVSVTYSLYNTAGDVKTEFKTSNTNTYNGELEVPAKVVDPTDPGMMMDLPEGAYKLSIMANTESGVTKSEEFPITVGSSTDDEED